LVGPLAFGTAGNRRRRIYAIANVIRHAARVTTTEVVFIGSNLRTIATARAIPVPITAVGISALAASLTLVAIALGVLIIAALTAA
jgi:hypothetical protein